MVVSGCSRASSGSGSGDAKVTLVWWTHDNPSFVEANKKRIEEYKKIKPNVTINYQYFPYDAFIQKAKAAYAGNNAPDIAQLFGTWVTDYAKNGHLDQAPNQEDLKQNFFEAALGAYTVDDKIYGIPQEYNLENGGVLAHPQMFKDKGITYPPKTYAELIDAAKQLTVRDGNKIKVKGFDFVSGDNIFFTFLSFILQQNADYWTSDGHVNLTGPEAVTAMTKLKELITVDKVTDLSRFGDNLDSSDYFFKGSSAMTIRGPWTIASGVNTYKVNDFEYIPMPSLTDSPPYFAAESGWGEVVAAKSKHKEEAWAFVNYMNQKEQALDFNVTTFTVPARKDAAEDPAYLQKLPMLKTSIDVLQYGKWVGPVQDRDFFVKSVNDNFQLIASDKMSVEDGLKKIEQSVNEMIDKHLSVGNKSS
ncbi:ABC transporter substrate-binding protein [Cohnella pontilimi]|uniref:ABC transporter substrate-binding protein n=2 Tax=Cohnella pontilimi TaxID=2564100 RepID=A0A4U0F399_9BACL|nr:ABC transporter substrate-binding protein [Cohnella pontilimi]